MKNAVVFILVNDIGEFLAERRIKPDVHFDRLLCPGGKIEEGEDPVGALNREMREELGVQPTFYSHLPVTEPDLNGYVLHPYLVLDWTPKRIPAATLDHQAPLLWVTPDKLKECFDKTVAFYVEHAEAQLGGSDRAG